MRANRWIALINTVLLTNVAIAGDLEVRVIGVDGAPVPDVAVFVKQSGATERKITEPAAAIMDQRDVRFVPHILVVEKGAAVSFPNSDVIAHHVYSFSRPNDFILPLYKGTPPGPVVMQHDGVVILGCNIHDGMLGYIVVVDTDVFGVTDDSGRVLLDVNAAASDYEVGIWSPRIRDSQQPLVQHVATVPSDGVTFNLEKSLRPGHVHESDAVEWDAY